MISSNQLIHHVICKLVLLCYRPHILFYTIFYCKTQFRLNIGREPSLPPWRRAALPEPEPGGAEPGNPNPSINDITSRPDQHGGSFDQPPGTAQQAVGAMISRIYDPRACSFV
ncbi:unnamed protein product [Nesidiocoris tenuis]|uniref:Uncharacterized protein n=1 Tax=Nesidiocoris tenuis TaxID=355587 RepID=A0A6H5FYT7_9HEMI|nr:unnamed protein product [Nesidiocoris tenuis]